MTENNNQQSEINTLLIVLLAIGMAFGLFITNMNINQVEHKVEMLEYDFDSVERKIDHRHFQLNNRFDLIDNKLKWINR